MTQNVYFLKVLFEIFTEYHLCPLHISESFPGLNKNLIDARASQLRKQPSIYFSHLLVEKLDTLALAKNLLYFCKCMRCVFLIYPEQPDNVFIRMILIGGKMVEDCVFQQSVSPNLELCEQCLQSLGPNFSYLRMSGLKTDDR